MKTKTIICLCLILFFTAASAQYTTPSHSSGICTPTATGKAQLSRVHIYDSDFFTRFFMKNVSSTCFSQNTSGGHYRLYSNSTDCYLSAGSSYSIQLLGVNPDTTSSLIYYGVWIDLNLSLIHISEPTRPY